MPFVSLVYLGLALAAIGFVLATFVFLAWAFLGQRGDARIRRLRIALCSALLFIAALLSAISMMYLVLMPYTIRHLRPGFARPYDWLSDALSTIGPVSVFASVGLVMRVIWRRRGTQKVTLLISLGCFVLFLVAGAANYALIHLVQVPAFERYAMIESRSWRTHVGEPAPDIEVVTLNGSRARLSDVRGKVVLVNFFATWCGPCLHELPHLQQMWNDLHANDDFRMLVIGRKESLESAADFRSKNGYTFPIAVDPDASAYSQFADEGIPRTYLVSRDGIILYQSIGFGEIDVYTRELESLRRVIEKELTARP